MVNNKNGKRYVKEKFLSINVNNEGYCQVSLTTTHKSKLYFIHRLVAQAFIPNPENKPNVNHKDLNPYNNNYRNLEWCTQKENVKHAIENGRYANVFKAAKKKKPKGFNSNLRIKIVQMDLDGEIIKVFDGIKLAADTLGLHSGNIVKACKGQQHTCGGYKWKYYEGLENRNK